MDFFNQLPISPLTLKGLTAANFLQMTEVQKLSLPLSLKNSDILGAAKTGSGKTLAFIVPILEKLFAQKWSHSDGLGAIIISPTRELALQIFGVLKLVGKFHAFSAGLIIGGKDLEFEKDRISKMNILVCTPGRLLQHMDQTPGFDTSNLQILVLDEADRILDLGFKKTVNAIIENIPKTRQTLLFSATQTRNVKDLARLSLNEPEYIAVHENDSKSTPENLVQNYLVCEVHEKLNVLFSFIKSHVKSKCIVFMSSCKQVRFVYETFCKMQPGTVLMCLHGSQKQIQRNTMFDKFCKSKYAVLFCTDIAARGLDFPSIDWVIQLDAPDDGDTYIHRAGRTARFKSNGRALLMLTPSEEEGYLKVFEKKKIPITKTAANSSQIQSIQPQLQSICAQYPEIKYLGEKSFICYLRSIWLQKNKEVFDVTKYQVNEYAESLGLPGAPQVKFVRKLTDAKNRSKANQKMIQTPVAVDPNSSEDENIAKPTRMDKLFAKKSQVPVHTEKLKCREPEDNHEISLFGGATNDDEGDGLLKLVRKDHELNGVPLTAPSFDEKNQSVRDKRKSKLKNKIKSESNGTRVIFDDEGEAHLAWKLENEQEFNASGDVLEKHLEFVETMRGKLKEADQVDRVVQKQKLFEKKIKAKNRLRNLNTKEDVTVTLGSNEYASETEDGSISNKRVSEETDRIPKKPRTIQEDEDLALQILGIE